MGVAPVEDVAERGTSALARPLPLHAVRVDRLHLRNFRNVPHVERAVPPAGLVLVGENGHGKTNVLEAIHYGHALRSLRGAKDHELIRFGEGAFFVGLVASGARVDSLGMGYERVGKRKRLTVDGVEASRLTAVLGAIPSVVLSPRDIELVTGSPSDRRRYLDIVLATTSPRYMQALQRYRAALVRRNAVLRESNARDENGRLAAIWEPALAESGAVLWRARRGWVESLAPRVQALCEAIGQSDQITIALEASAELAADAPEGELQETLTHLFERERGQDVRRGVTRRGPHRDDLALLHATRPARVYGSAGQQRTIAIALRLAEAETLRDVLGRTPLLLLDDPFAEFDQGRSRRLLELILALGSGQRIIAVPREDEVPEAFSSLARWRIWRGEVSDA